MKNKIPLFIMIIIILFIALVWLIVDRQDYQTDPKVPKHDKVVTDHEDLDELEQMKQDALIRWQANCEADGGTWISEYELCFTEEIALMMKESCELFEGVWIEDSMLYECQINGELFKLGEWEMIEWEMYKEMKSSCIDHNGSWLGGADMACSINGDIFYVGMWQVLDEMQESCNEFNGQWLGGEENECEIDGRIYPGNWVQVFAMKDSCETSNGTWLGGDDNQCRVSGQIYSRQAWERIDEMKESCESIGGEYIGGDRFRCNWDGNVYFDKSWERAAKAPSLGERCVEDGGTWDAGRRACSGLQKEWCDNVLVELDLGAVGWNRDTLSCIIY